MTKAISFDDVLIVPKFSEIKSRAEVDMSFLFLGDKYDLPVISSNMDTVTEYQMARAMDSNGAMACLHRFMSIEDNVIQFQESPYNVFVSVGVGAEELKRAITLYESGARKFVIDVAHGAAQHVVEQYDELRTNFPDAQIVVGNFATKESILAFNERVQSGSLPDAYKVGVGGGCFAAGTRVLMSNGTYKDIEKIQLGDRVINKNGIPVSVIGVKFSGIKKVVRYKSNTHFNMTFVTPEHLHWVGDYSTTKDINSYSKRKVLDKLTKAGESKYKWSRIDSTKNTNLLLPKNIKYELPETFDIKLSDFFEARRGMNGLIDTDISIQPTYDLGYIVGTFLGDGNSNITKSNRNGRKNTSAITQWYFGKDEMDVAEKLSIALRSVFNVNAKIKFTKKGNIIHVLVRNNFLSRFFNQFGKKTEKHLPIKYLCSNMNYLKGIYDGLLDSDGHYASDGRDSLTNTSTSLIELFMLLSKLINGYYPSVQRRSPRIGGLSNCNIENCKPNFIARTLKTPDNQLTKDYQIVPNHKVDEIDLFLPTYDIEVDCETHSFIANNVIVHNSMCTTRVVTGCGLPTLHSIIDCRKIPNITIIADGGIKNSGDIAKALAAGADAVMLGSMLSGTTEAPGDNIVMNHNTYKTYRGSASLESYHVQGKSAQHRTPEGESTLVPVKGSVDQILQQIEGGLRSAFSYVGARNINEFRENVQLIEVTTSSAIESTAHGKKN